MLQSIEYFHTACQSLPADSGSFFMAVEPSRPIRAIQKALAKGALSTFAWLLALIWLHWAAGIQIDLGVVVLTVFLVITLTMGLLLAPLLWPPRVSRNTPTLDTPAIPE